jgi:hypothetical protein
MLTTILVNFVSNSDSKCGAFNSKTFHFILAYTENILPHLLFYYHQTIHNFFDLVLAYFNLKLLYMWYITYLAYIFNLGALQTFHDSTHRISLICRSPKEVSREISRSFSLLQFLPTVF